MKSYLTSLIGLTVAVSMIGFAPSRGQAQDSPTGANLATVAKATASSVSGDSSVVAMTDDGRAPRNSRDTRTGMYGNWPSTGTTWVQYEWTKPISTKSIDVYWWTDGNGVGLPKASRVLYWNGSAFIPVANVSGLGTAGNKFNTTTFDEVTTPKLRLEIDSDGTLSTGILRWKVYDSGKSPEFPPSVVAGIDRDVMLDGKTYLAAKVKALKAGAATSKVAWSKESGPGEVVFAKANAAETTATFSQVGDYVLKLTAGEGELSGTSTLKVKVNAPPPSDRLNVVYTKRYSIDSPLWNNRAKALIVDWIPHCIEMINRTNLTQGQGGIDNFIEAGKALRGEPHAQHKGFVFANAWVHQTVESMCIALMVDPKGDKDIIAAQAKMKVTLEDWIPKILAAQESDGYLQTAWTLRDTNRWHERWSRESYGNHEGYTAGYFIESAINHYTLTEGKDKRLYNAAKKLADCWVANIGPDKKKWHDGHQEMEQALVRFGRFVNDMEGPGHGDNYVQLAKFLLDNRGSGPGGSEYDQSALPVQQQYEAVGHAVRAVYNYSGMADVAAETHDVDYQSAVMSLWDNLINKKYYITGGIGSGETSEGFGADYSLRNNAYCEACSSCGLIFFEYKMNIAYHDAKYADLYEETMYNALLGSIDLQGENFYYDNPLIGGRRTSWHNCPCCVGNIPRTLLMIPTWTYAKGTNGLYVNLFIGSTIKVEKVAGTDIEMVQKTDYPWNGDINITVNPKASKKFTMYVRVPNRTTSELYKPTPEVKGYTTLTVNGKAVTPTMENGYAAITRTWKKGDKIEMVLPMEIQRVKADEHIAADRGDVALRYGPLIYNVEQADQPDITKTIGNGPLTAQFRPDLLNGVMTIKGQWSDGTPLLAIPNYARNNRTGIAANNEVAAGAPGIDYSGGATIGTTNIVAGAPPRRRRAGNEPASMVWIKD